MTDSGLNVELRENEKPLSNKEIIEKIKSFNNVTFGSVENEDGCKCFKFKATKGSASGVKNAFKKNGIVVNLNDDNYVLKIKSAGKSNVNEKKEIKSWINQLVEEEYHTFTQKKEIMSLIQTKLNENSFKHETGPNVKSGHNNIPEWFTYEKIAASAEPAIAPPVTKPNVKPKRDNPFRPSPTENPRPKAGATQNAEPAIAPPVTKPNVKPKRDNPFRPSPTENPRPKARFSEK
jgi:hypothetical protein